MKKIIIFTMLLLIAYGVQVQGNHVKTTDYFMISASVLDSAGEAEQHAESVHVMTYFKGFECIDAWYLAADAQCQTINGELMFFDQYGDLDADSGDGAYYIRYAFIDSNGALYHKGNHHFRLGLFGDTVQVNVSVLTEDSHIGIDGDDVSGDFEAGDFGASCLDDKGNWNVGKTGYSLTAGGLSAVVTWALIDSLADTIWVNTKFVAAIDSLGDTTWFKTHGDANWATSDGDTAQVNVATNSDIIIISAKIDTIAWMGGLVFGKMYFNPANDRDTVYYLNEVGDTIGYRFWEHESSTPNSPPDSIIIGRH